MLDVKGKPRKVATAKACKGLAALLGRGLKGPGAGGLGAVLAARACGNPDPAGAAELLARLGLGAAPALPAPAAPSRPSATSGGTILQTPGGGSPPPAPPTTPAVPAACAQSSGVGQADDPKQLFVGINEGCGTFTRVTVSVSPGVASCQAFSGDSSFTCSVAVASGGTAGLLDMTLKLTGEAKCSVPATVTLTRPNGDVAQLVEPIGDCGLIAVKPQCADGIDDDGDGMTDARDGAGATDPDPGCTGPADTTEGSDGAPPEGCRLEVDAFQDDPRFTYLYASGCGALQGIWFKPPGTPTDCAFRVGTAAALGCSVTGMTAGATFAPTTDDVIIAAHVAADPACAPITAALTLAGGAVVSARGRWC